MKLLLQPDAAEVRNKQTFEDQMAMAGRIYSIQIQ